MAIGPTPPGPGPQRQKRLIVACDGTWMDSDNGVSNQVLQLPSNVSRICRAITVEGRNDVTQIVYYQPGVGTVGNMIDRIRGGATGEGLSHNIREAYAFLAHNYSDGDEIFLLGFSRGAFTARTIAGLIGNMGLLTKEGLPFLPIVFKDFENRGVPNYESPLPNLPFANKPSASNPAYQQEMENRRLTRLGIRIKAVAVWDTVGSLGIPRVTWLEKLGLQAKSMKELTFGDTIVSDCVENAFQALALDEHRAAFSPAVWEKSPTNKTYLRQVWFPGVHSNVGGGYEDADIANITLAWMVAQLESMLDFQHDYLLQQFQENKDYYLQSGLEPRLWSFGKIYNSLEGFYIFGGGKVRTPGAYVRVDADTALPTGDPLRSTFEQVHPSVRSRLMLGGPGIVDSGTYKGHALRDYTVRLTGTTPEQKGPLAVWESRAKTNGQPQRVLPESTMSETELMLLSQSPSVYQDILEGEGRSSG